MIGLLYSGQPTSLDQSSSNGPNGGGSTPGRQAKEKQRHLPCHTTVWVTIRIPAHPKGARWCSHQGSMGTTQKKTKT